MSVYVGIDVHRKRSQVAVVADDGQVQLNRKRGERLRAVPAADRDRAGVSQPHLLQQARQRRALRRLGTAAALFRRGPRGFQIAAVGFLARRRKYFMPDLSQFNIDRTYPGLWTITFSNPPINMFLPTTTVELGALMTGPVSPFVRAGGRR